MIATTFVAYRWPWWWSIILAVPTIIGWAFLLKRRGKTALLFFAIVWIGIVILWITRP